MSRKTHEQGWEDCLEAIDKIRQDGQKVGKDVAHLDEETRSAMRYNETGGLLFYRGMLHIPYDVRQWAYAAGFDQGVAGAQAEARRIGLLIDQQKQVDAPKPAQAKK